MALMETFQDNFDFGGIDSGKWSNFGGSQVNIGTNLDAEFTSSLGGNYIGIESLTTYDLTGSYGYSQVVDAGNQSITSWEVYPVYLIKDSNNNMYIRITGNQVACFKTVATVNAQIGTNTAYSSSTMKYFRIRESGGTTFFDYATDPTSTWTNLTSVTNPFAVTALNFELLCGTWQAEASTTTAKLDNVNTYPTQYQFTWSGFTWNKRIHQANVTGQTWSASNISGPDGNGYITLNLTNAGSSPIGCEIFSVQRGFGYGTYTSVIGTRLDNTSLAVGFGGMFTFDFTAPPDYKEIDMHETRPYNGLSTKQILYNHAWNNGGSINWVTDNFQQTSDTYQTHQCIWLPNEIIYRTYSGVGTGGTLVNYVEHKANIPVKGLERVHFNVFVDTSVAGYASASPIGVIIQSFSFTPHAYPASVYSIQGFQ